MGGLGITVDSRSWEEESERALTRSYSDSEPVKPQPPSTHRHHGRTGLFGDETVEAEHSWKQVRIPPRFDTRNVKIDVQDGSRYGV